MRFDGTAAVLTEALNEIKAAEVVSDGTDP
jgi:hypothetical protein